MMRRDRDISDIELAEMILFENCTSLGQKILNVYKDAELLLSYALLIGIFANLTLNFVEQLFF